MKPGKRFQLRLYNRLFAMVRWPTFLLAVGALVLWGVAAAHPLLAEGRWLALIIFGLSAILWGVSLIAPRLCFVQCRADHVLISTLLHRQRLSYSRVLSVTPVNFGQLYPLPKQAWSQRRFLAPLFREQSSNQLTVIALRFKKYPKSLRWRKLWFADYMLVPNSPGLLLMVTDWMTLSQQLEDYRNAWRERHYGKQLKEASMAIRILTHQGGKQ